MTKPQGKFTPFYSPIDERQKEEGANDDTNSRCGCFPRFCFRWVGGDSHNNHLFQERGADNKETWEVTQLKKLKQIPELVAGPKWKNLIRKFGKLCSHPRKHSTSSVKTQFQYSPEGYSLNFDHEDEEEEYGNLLHNFSSRFAPHQ